MITKGKCLDHSKKFSQLIFFIYFENYGDQFGEFVFEYWGLKDD